MANSHMPGRTEHTRAAYIDASVKSAMTRASGRCRRMLILPPSIMARSLAKDTGSARVNGEVRSLP